MTDSPFGVTAVLNIHREGLLLAPTLRSIRLAKARALADAHVVEVLAVLDRPDELTVSVLRQFDDVVDRIEEVDFGDLGAARAHGVARATHDWVFLHDGDDLFSENWYKAFYHARHFGQIDPRTVYHTQIFARFGEVLDLKTLMDSEDPRFHPLFLASEWYYSNKCVVHRDLFREFPLPHNSKRTGIGNEDWNWACHTLHAGIRHSVLPETVCFYRVKPAELSLGLTPGMMQDASPLFDPANIAALARRRVQERPPLRNFSQNSAMVAEPVIGEPALPWWFWQEVDRQGALESMITEFHGLRPDERRMWLPNLHYNVVSAIEYMMVGLDHRPKVFLFASMGTLRAADMMVELFLEGARELHGTDCQPVLIVDDGDQAFSDLRLEASHGAKVISVRKLREYYRLEDWYFRRVMMRPLVQFMRGTVIDLGSDVFRDIFSEFQRTVLENQAEVRMVFAEPRPDPLAPAFLNIARNARAWRAHTGRPVPVAVHPDALPLFADRRVWAPVPFDAATLAAFEGVTRERYRAIGRAEGIDLAALLAAPPDSGRPPPAPHPAAAFSPRARDLGGVELAELELGGDRVFLLRSRDAWVSPGWVQLAALLLAERADVDLVSPNVTVGRGIDGEAVAMRHGFEDAARAYGRLYDANLHGARMPVVAMARVAPDLPVSCRPQDLARALYRSARAGAQVAVAQDSVAVTVDGELYPPADLPPPPEGDAGPGLGLPDGEKGDA